MREELAKDGAKVDAVYYCPHHPKARIRKYRVLCRCRKPNPGMVMAAAKRFNISLKNSFMIGDATGDIMTGSRSKLKTILLKTGYAGQDGKYAIQPDFVAKDLFSAVAIIKELQSGHAKR